MWRILRQFGPFLQNRMIRMKSKYWLTGLPDGKRSYQKSKGLGMTNFGIFSGSLKYYAAIWCILPMAVWWFWGHFGIFSPILVYFPPFWYIVQRKIRQHFWLHMCCIFAHSKLLQNLVTLKVAESFGLVFFKLTMLPIDWNENVTVCCILCGVAEVIESTSRKEGRGFKSQLG
jgi:hypothetical protein